MVADAAVQEREEPVALDPGAIPSNGRGLGFCRPVEVQVRCGTGLTSQACTARVTRPVLCASVGPGDTTQHQGTCAKGSEEAANRDSEATEAIYSVVAATTWPGN